MWINFLKVSTLRPDFGHITNRQADCSIIPPPRSLKPFRTVRSGQGEDVFSNIALSELYLVPKLGHACLRNIASIRLDDRFNILEWTKRFVRDTSKQNDELKALDS